MNDAQPPAVPGGSSWSLGCVVKMFGLWSAVTATGGIAYANYKGLSLQRDVVEPIVKFVIQKAESMIGDYVANMSEETLYGYANEIINTMQGMMGGEGVNVMDNVVSANRQLLVVMSVVGILTGYGAEWWTNRNERKKFSFVRGGMYSLFATGALFALKNEAYVLGILESVNQVTNVSKVIKWDDLRTVVRGSIRDVVQQLQGAFSIYGDEPKDEYARFNTGRDADHDE